MSPNSILAQIKRNEKEIDRIERSGRITGAKKNRLKVLHQAQDYWHKQYEKLSGRKLTDGKSIGQRSVTSFQANSKCREHARRFLNGARSPKWRVYGYIVQLSGDVMVRKGVEGGGDGWRRAVLGEPIFENFNVRTRKGTATLRFTDGTRVTMGPNDLAVIYDVAPRPPRCDVHVNTDKLQEGLKALRTPAQPST